MNRVAMLAPLAALCLIATAAHAQTPAKTASPQPAFVLSSLDTKFTGDLDGMIKRRLIRILAPYSKTFYFVDRGVQRGLTYEISEILERDLNKRLKTGNVRVHVAIIPMSHDEFVPALREGWGHLQILSGVPDAGRGARGARAGQGGRQAGQVVDRSSPQRLLSPKYPGACRPGAGGQHDDPSRLPDHHCGRARRRHARDRTCRRRAQG